MSELLKENKFRKGTIHNGVNDRRYRKHTFKKYVSGYGKRVVIDLSFSQKLQA
jgi:hypothetical protein